MGIPPQGRVLRLCTWCRGLAKWKKNASLDIYLVREVKERRHDRRCQDVNARQTIVYCELRQCKERKGWQELGLLDSAAET